MADRLLRRFSAMAAVLLLTAGAAEAHPHVFITSSMDLKFDDAGRLAGIADTFVFDEVFSSYATQGLDKNGDGVLSREELADLAKTNVTSMKEFDYFTYVLYNKEIVGLADPTDYSLEYAEGRLTLHFFLPLKTPLAIASVATVDVRDPTIFVAFTMSETRPVTATGLPARCVLYPAAATSRGSEPRNRSTVSCDGSKPEPATSPGNEPATIDIGPLLGLPGFGKPPGAPQ